MMFFYSEVSKATVFNNRIKVDNIKNQLKKKYEKIARHIV